MKVLIVSDTHGRDYNLEEVVEKEAPFDMLVHCGDVEGREFFIEALAECPCCIVSGNNDFFSDLPREEEIMISGKRFLVTHGHYYAISGGNIDNIVGAARSRGCDGVIFGHIHRPIVEERNGFWAINPGSLVYPRQEGRKPSYVVLKTDCRGKIDARIEYLK